MIHKMITVFKLIRKSLRAPYFGFVQGHAHVSQKELQKIKVLVGEKSDGIVSDFETQFAKLVGNGQAVSFAAGRMGFYSLMSVLGIKEGDEVILLGATCAVMVHAVLKTGATPIFSDIDPHTFGSSAKNIESCLTLRTKMIVAQHSFGIPCDIEPIVELAKSRNIFLLEDCALTLGSKVNGTIVGNYGDAALFSTDHSKPLNTLIGGLMYTQNVALAYKLRLFQSACPELSKDKQKALWHRLLLEKDICTPDRYARMDLVDRIESLRNRILQLPSPFLSDDFSPYLLASYPYPAKMPAFLAKLGLLELCRWPQVALERRAILKSFLADFRNRATAKNIPFAYSDERIDIVPLRFAWHQHDGTSFRNSIEQFIHVPWTWFMQPIIATSTPLERFQYRYGSCPISEKIGPNMVNIPCNVLPDEAKKIVQLLKEIA